MAATKPESASTRETLEARSANERDVTETSGQSAAKRRSGLGWYTGPVILREPEPASSAFPRKAYPQWRSIYGKLVMNHQVTLEDELREIRARHAGRREYHRALAAARRARLKNTRDTVDHCEMDEPDPR